MAKKQKKTPEPIETPKAPPLGWPEAQLTGKALEMHEKLDDSPFLLVRNALSRLSLRQREELLKDLKPLRAEDLLVPTQWVKLRLDEYVAELATRVRMPLFPVANLHPQQLVPVRDGRAYYTPETHKGHVFTHVLLQLVEVQGVATVAKVILKDPQDREYPNSLQYHGTEFDKFVPAKLLQESGVHHFLPFQK